MVRARVRNCFGVGCLVRVGFEVGLGSSLRSELKVGLRSGLNIRYGVAVGCWESGLKFGSKLGIGCRVMVEVRV
ncbi:hypothetical protein HAX54_052656, partial [Datura stramonium]|nr:hypothetical protein [Datura stramonium]